MGRAVNSGASCLVSGSGGRSDLVPVGPVEVQRRFFPDIEFWDWDDASGLPADIASMLLDLIVDGSARSWGKMASFMCRNSCCESNDTE